MIPAVIATGVAVAAGVALLSSDDDKKKTETTSVRQVSDDYVKQKMAKSGRQIKTVGGRPNNTASNYKTSESSVERVYKIIATQLDLDANAIKMSDRIIEDLGANYNDKCLILDLIGEEFNVNFFGKQISTVGNIFNYISSNEFVERRPNNAAKNYKTSASPVERVKQIIAEQLDLDANAIKMSDRIIEDLGANYNDKCLILDLIGKEFNVNFFGKQISTVGNIFNYIS